MDLLWFCVVVAAWRLKGSSSAENMGQGWRSERSLCSNANHRHVTSLYGFVSASDNMPTNVPIGGKLLFLVIGAYCICSFYLGVLGILRDDQHSDRQSGRGPSLKTM